MSTQGQHRGFVRLLEETLRNTCVITVPAPLGGGKDSI
jgi:hypothetical protein